MPDASAHSNHHHTQNPGPEEIVKAANEQIRKLVKEEKLEKSWLSGHMVSIDKKKFKGGLEWLVIFANSKAKGKDKAKLFLFFQLSGKFLAANHTGK